MKFKHSRSPVHSTAVVQLTAPSLRCIPAGQAQRASAWASLSPLEDGVPPHQPKDGLGWHVRAQHHRKDHFWKEQAVRKYSSEQHSSPSWCSSFAMEMNLKILSYLSGSSFYPDIRAAACHLLSREWLLARRHFFLVLSFTLHLQWRDKMNSSLVWQSCLHRCAIRIPPWCSAGWMF